MAQAVSIIFNDEDRERFEGAPAIAPSGPINIQRAKMMLLSTDRLPVLEVARRAGVSRPAVWRWQQRYNQEGVDGPLRDKTREPGRLPPLDRALDVGWVNLIRTGATVRSTRAKPGLMLSWKTLASDPIFSDLSDG
jgi:hypothetical protein